MIINLNDFQGMAPALDATSLPEQMATIATNCKVGNRKLKPLRDFYDMGALLGKTGDKTSLFLYRDGLSDYWFHWIGLDVDAVASPLPNDSHKRLYWTGDSYPKMAPLTVAAGADPTDRPANAYRLGLPIPAQSVPTLIGTLGADPVKYESRTYVTRYVSEYGEVGPPSEASALIDVDPTAGNTVSLDIPGAPAGNYNIRHLDIFRTNTGSQGTEYQLVKRVSLDQAQEAAWDIGTTYATGEFVEYNTWKYRSLQDANVGNTPDAEPTWWAVESSLVWTDTTLDNVLAQDLDYVLDSTGYLPPEDTMIGLLSLPNGALCGFFGNVVCFSEPYQPHAWPAAYQYAMTSKVVAIAAYGASVFVATEGYPQVLTGPHPNSMSNERFEEGYPCISKRSMTDMGYSAMYATPFGLMQVGTNGAKLVTLATISRDEWPDFDAKNFVSFSYFGRYVAFNGSKGFIFDPASGTYTEIQMGEGLPHGTGGCMDLANGKLYVTDLDTANVYEFDGSGTRRTMEWRSKEFVPPMPVNMAVIQVFASAYPVSAKVYYDGMALPEVTITSKEPQRLPSDQLASSIMVRIQGTSDIIRVTLATSMAELANV